MWAWSGIIDERRRYRKYNFFTKSLISSLQITFQITFYGPHFTAHILRPTVQNSGTFFPRSLNELNTLDNNIKVNKSFPIFKKSLLE